jgi:hypothetical protein
MSSSLTGKAGDGGLPLGDRVGEVEEGEAVLLEALLRHVEVVVAVLLVEVDDGHLALESLAVDLLGVVGEEGLVLAQALVLRAAHGHRRGADLALVEMGHARVQRDDVLHRRDDVLEAEGAAGEGREREVLVLARIRARQHVAARRELPEVVVQLDGDLVPADLGEVVLAQVLEDEVVEVGLGLAGDDELLAAELLVDVLLRFLHGLDLVLAQRLEDGGVVLLGVAGEHLDGGDLLVQHALDGFMRDFLAGLEQDLARALVDDVLAGDAVEQALHRRGPDLDGLVRVEDLQDVRVGLDAAGAQEGRRLELLLAVDAHEEDVVEVELELDPGATVRDDLGEEELLAERGDLLLLVLLEDDAGRAVQLRDDDALGAVDDEGRGVRHDRDLAEHDFLLDDLLELAGGLAGGEAEDGLQGARPAAVVVLRLLGGGVARSGELVADEIEDHGAVGGLDGEHVEERGLEADELALLGLDAQLHEVAEGVGLHLQQVRHLHRLRDLAELDLFHVRSLFVPIAFVR